MKKSSHFSGISQVKNDPQHNNFIT